MAKILVVTLKEMNSKHIDQLKAAAGEMEIIFSLPGQVTKDQVEEADIIIGNPPPAFLKNSNVKLLQLTSAGADTFLKGDYLPEDTTLCCCTGAYSQSVAEHALAATMAVIKSLHLYRDDQNECKWADEGETSSIDGSTVLIVGLGDIGKYYARMVKALGAHVIGVKNRTTDKPDYVDEVYSTSEVDNLLPRADIIMSALPSTKDTHHFYSLERFSRMKRTAAFINIGRGDAVDTEVLNEVLEKNMIRCAAVDVFEIEPLPEDSPLWKQRNLLITPHASGFFHLPATMGRVVDICSKNLESWLNGSELINVVDKKLGYKK